MAGEHRRIGLREFNSPEGVIIELNGCCDNNGEHIWYDLSNVNKRTKAEWTPRDCAAI
jgi:hypothetical protein